MMTLEKILSIGTDNQSFSVANKARMVNLIGFITTIISGLYTLSYVFVFDNFIVATINALFTIAYMATLVFNYFKAFRGSKLWFFSILMLHILVCTNIYVTNASGFHLYFFLVPTGAFLLFELREKMEKVALSLIAVILFFYCENTLNTQPLIELSDGMNHLIYQSVILVNMLEVILVLTLFANEIETNELKLTRQATTDSLTGIANRHSFFEQGNRIFQQALDDARPVSVMIIDLDYFKRINDQYGHFAGDLCLTEVTKLISRACREQDFFARIGGEEFALILPDTTLTEANNIAEEMRFIVQDHIIPAVGKQNFSCTASFGIASREQKTEKLKDVLIHADKALYLAKELGRNRVQTYKEAS